ncbi:MAG: hypothetical protein ABIN94_22805 [Ferruginibacter sp.]
MKSCDCHNEKCYTRKQPLNWYAYQRMMRQHYSFTILGTQSPVSGFKFETSKPTATLKGNIYSSRQKELLVNLEITGGADNDLLQIFSGESLNGFFKANLGFNLMLKGRQAIYEFEDQVATMLLRKRACEYREKLALQIDTAVVLSTIMATTKSPKITLDELVIRIMGNRLQDIFEIKDYRPVNIDNTDHYKDIVMDLVKRYGKPDTGKTNRENYEIFIKALASKTDQSLGTTDKMLIDMARLSKFKSDKDYKYDLLNDNEIETYKNIWKSKSISWLNISAAGSNSTFKMYDAVTQTLNDANSFIPALSITFNHLYKGTGASKYFYIRAGLTFKKSNSLVDLTKFEYVKETVVNTNPNEPIKTSKSGTAYEGLLSSGVGFEIPVEVFASPWNNESAPGFYAKVMYSYGDPWINKNKVSLDLGLIWNVLNNDKESNSVLTVIPYISWRNLVKEYKDLNKTIDKPLSDLFSYGIKFGIPIKLGK